MPREIRTPDLAGKSSSYGGKGISSRALSAAKKRIVTEGAGEKALRATRDDYARVARKTGKAVAEGSAEETGIWRRMAARGPLNLGGLKQLTRAAAKGLLSPAALGETVALEVAARSKPEMDRKKQEMFDDRIGSKSPKTLAAMKKARKNTA